jgi:surface protein
MKFKTNDQLKAAVELWTRYGDKTTSTFTYSHIKTSIEELIAIIGEEEDKTYKKRVEKVYGNISNWTFEKEVTSMRKLFYQKSEFNEDLSGWDVSNVTDMSHMFQGATMFNNGNKPLEWATNNLTNVEWMFESATTFNQKLEGWNMSKVTTMSYMFCNATMFNNGGNNNPLNWTTDKLTNMRGMFESATTFNQKLEGWNVSNVTDMHNMFYNAKTFNQKLEGWNVGNVTDMGGMFWNAEAFNQELKFWDMRNVKNMHSMFRNAKVFNNGGKALKWWTPNFNDPTVSTEHMFDGAEAFNQKAFNQKIGGGGRRSKTDIHGSHFRNGSSSSSRREHATLKRLKARLQPSDYRQIQHIIRHREHASGVRLNHARRMYNGLLAGGGDG